MGARWETERPSELFRRKQRELHNFVIPAMARAMARDMNDNIRRLTPIGIVWAPPGAEFATRIPSGALQRSIEMDRKGAWSAMNIYRWEVTTDKHYAPYVEYGTRPHIIRARRPGGYLSFHTGPVGEQVETRVVHHPGTRPVYMFTRGVAMTRAKAYTIMSKYIGPWAADNSLAMRTMAIGT